MAADAHHIFPDDVAGRQFKTVMRPAAFLFISGNLFFRQTQGTAVINRRATLGQQCFAHQFQFFRRFVTRVNQSFRNQFCRHFPVTFRPRGLPGFARPHQSQPLQGVAYFRFIFFFGAFLIGIVDPQHKASAQLLRQQPVEQRGSGIADMHVPGRRRRESDFDF